MDKFFEKYQKRMTKIGIFKSVIFSLVISFIFMGIVAIITLLSKASLSLTLALTFGLGGAIFILSAFLLYFKRFKPTSKMIAEKLDSLCMDERYITMIECGENSSYIAKLQRDDAKQRLSTIPSKCLKFSLAIPVIILLVFSFAFALGATTVSSLQAADIIGSHGNQSEIIEPPPKEIYTINYLVYTPGTGTIAGDGMQKIESGKNSSPVMAVPAEGYKFVAWVDENKNYLENKNNPRVELNVHENLTIYALFEEKDEQNVEDENKGSGGEGEGEKIPGTSEGGDESGDNQGEVGGGGTSPSGGAGRDNNNVIDGGQDYKENFDREQYENELTEKDVPDELKDILGDYYDTLKP